MSKRKGSGKRKGSAYEREICQELSYWWSHGKDDNIFYRSQSSGGRATSRKKRNKETSSNHGDITCVDKAGRRFIKVVTVEIKRGYSKNTIFDLIDKRTDALQTWEKHILQAMESSSNAGSLSWMIISKRNFRKAVVILPMFFVDTLISVGAKLDAEEICPGVSLKVQLGGQEEYICVVLLSQFLKQVKPRMIRKLHRCFKHHKGIVDQRSPKWRSGFLSQTKASSLLETMGTSLSKKKTGDMK